MDGHKINKLFIILTCSLFFFAISNSTVIAETWQTKLESYFANVETFDNLNDWNDNSNTCYECYPPYGNYPVYTEGGGASSFEFYNSTNGRRCGNWIDNYGAAYDTKKSGKSYRCNYGDSCGPPRLAATWWDSATNGYDDGYVFVMVKVESEFMAPGILNESTGKYSNDGIGYFKVLNGAFGFRDGGNWGSNASQQNAVCGAEGSGGSAQCRHVYGRDGFIINYQNDTYTGKLFLKFFYWYYTPNEIADPYGQNLTNIDISGPVRRDEWIGLEVRIKAGDGGTGLIEIWAYDEAGNELGSYRYSPHWTIGKYAENNHKFNRIMLGGNHGDGESRAWSQKTGYIYFDDLIFDNKRIGPMYFQLRNGGTPTSGPDKSAPQPPKNLRVLD